MNCRYIELVDWQQCSEDCRDRAVASNAYKKFHKKTRYASLPKKRRYAPPFFMRAF
jgi:hypothetical protein